MADFLRDYDIWLPDVLADSREHGGGMTSKRFAVLLQGLSRGASYRMHLEQLANEPEVLTDHDEIMAHFRRNRGAD